ncbi:Maltose/maltodextrin transport ATP-binding protein MalK [Rubellimicrobium mesophilum DSM 19309]|uniref:Maltose/maltodextrin transport ATP-binding protein MalK n=1 Tax=Rubellimicrobium mesophilum DSM 19309 TaxID=442562 RepID=A0A017HLX2_9RHOB|nr:sn-glycerol-3-phosphate ABC transporter ATP-binding protein UgpC [Rubellimicrobium mesophilum]EYD74779.1 Maltose/maltodextrin transport ATP-binding protein MalK [Rubellimicrobium mesophilum DSM 19309]
MAGIELSGIAKSYGGTEVLRDVDLAVGEGEFVVLVGPSGCGKSTLLRMIAGLEPISAGELRIGGRRMNEVPPRGRDIAMVFQSYALYPHMTVARNMGFPMEIAHRPKAERAGPVARAAEVLGLQKLLDRYPRALSGGQRQRVAMGRAIVRQPQAFLFDEPLSNLDAALRVEMRLEIARLHHRIGATTVYVTHDQVEAMTLADRIVVMNAGRIQQVGTPMDLYDRPANRFVAGFIGSPTMNMVEGTPVPDGLRLADGTVWPAPPGARALGIRPEHLHVSPDGTGLRAEVQLIERLGSDTNLFCEAPGVGPLLARVHGDVNVALGSTVVLTPDLARLHPFDAEGRRVVQIR